MSPGPLSLDAAVRRVSGPGRGAVAAFSGCVRDAEKGSAIRAIAYEAYAEMAGPQLAEIAREAGERFGAAVCVRHRLGRVPVGEASLIAACAAPHRAEALAALSYVVERIKAEAAIWKVAFDDCSGPPPTEPTPSPRGRVSGIRPPCGGANFQLGEPSCRLRVNPIEIRVGILTVSDRGWRGSREDRSGPRLADLARARGWRVCATRVVPDEKERIAETLLEWSARGGVSVILTTGGTGLGPRDVTPEATRQVLEREIAGLPELMRAAGRARTPLACLSRMAAGTRGGTLILNLPGSPDGAEQSFEAAAGLIPHALEMLEGAGHEPGEDHGRA